MGMGTPNSEGIADSVGRYKSLGLRESFSQNPLYLYACRELSFILRNGSLRFPKNLHSLVFQDTLFAFSLLPEMQSQSAISAAYCLMQSSEMVFPKMKRATAVMEYKRAVIASKRKIKQNQEEESIFSFCSILVGLKETYSFFRHRQNSFIVRHLHDRSLDPVSTRYPLTNIWLAGSSFTGFSICSLSWNIIAGDHHLWRSLYAIYFRNPGIMTKNKHTFTCVKKNHDKNHSVDDNGDGLDIDWMFSFKIAYKGSYYRKFRSNRGYCFSCSSIVWLNANKCSNEPSIKDGSNHRTKPISIQQVTDYILEGSLLPESSSDSDSDADDIDIPLFKLWAYPREISSYRR